MNLSICNLWYWIFKKISNTYMVRCLFGEIFEGGVEESQNRHISFMIIEGGSSQH